MTPSEKKASREKENEVYLHLHLTDPDFPAWVLYSVKEGIQIFPIPPHREEKRGYELFHTLIHHILKSPELLPTFQFSVSIGPGSMTSIKLGIAVMMGIVFPLKKKLIPVPSFFFYMSGNVKENLKEEVMIPFPPGGAYIGKIDTRKWILLEKRFDPEQTPPPKKPNFALMKHFLPHLTPLNPEEIEPLYIRPPQTYPQKDLFGRNLHELYPSP